MSSFKNAIPRRAHKERAQPQARKKFGLLEKHKDYVVRATAFHKKEQALQKLKEKAASRNPDEFYFKMIKTKTVNGVHKLESQANKYTQEELMLMKTQDIGYILQKIQSEKKKIEKLTAMLHSLDNQPSNRRVLYAEDREEAEELASKASERSNLVASGNLPSSIRRHLFIEAEGSFFLIRSFTSTPTKHFVTAERKEGMQLKETVSTVDMPEKNLNLFSLLDVFKCCRIEASANRSSKSAFTNAFNTPRRKKTATSYRELEARKSRVRDLEKVYMDMAMQKELQKPGRKRKLREEELVNPTTKPVYKWKQERKR